MLRIHRRLFLTALMACMLVWGCSEEPTAPTPTPPVRKAPAPKPVVAQADAKGDASAEPPKYVYNPVGRRDPFTNPVKEVGAQGMEDGESLTPLQRVDLRQLRVVGVIVGRGEPAAMVIAPGGRSFILKKGVKVGKNDGVVIGIDAESIKIREKYYDFSGEVRTSVQELQLPKRGGVN